MRYRYLLADLDKTLLDFMLAEELAFGETMRQYGLPDSAEVLQLYSRLNDNLWKALERGEITAPALSVERYRQLLEALGRDTAPAAEVADAYEENLSHHGDTFPDTLPFLRQVKAAGMKLALVSNGFSRIQRGRLSRCGFADLADAIIISGEIGVSKPDPQVIDHALGALGCTDRSQAVMFGDSLTSDIACAVNAGIDSIWLTPEAKESPLPTYIVRTLHETALLLGIVPKPAFKAVLFDLDGTLTDTLGDIADSVEWALAKNGLPGHDRERYKYFVGNGARKLIERAVAPRSDMTDQVFADYIAHYGEHKLDTTAPYPGIIAMLERLKTAGLKLCVLSNKPHGDTCGVVKYFFPEGTFDAVRGQKEGVPVKPDPAAAFDLAEELGVKPEDFLYLGDTDVDMTCAARAGMTGVGVLWGFRKADELFRCGAKLLLKEPTELLKQL